MREIKFRAWQKRDKIMLLDVGVHPCIMEVHNGYKSDEPRAYTVSPMADNIYDIMQYTGLKDKNGVEIYEGDILKTDTEPTTVSYIETVSFDERFAEFLTDKGDLNYSCKDYSEVIGNIYQNKELLGKDNGDI